MMHMGLGTLWRGIANTVFASSMWHGAVPSRSPRPADMNAAPAVTEPSTRRSSPTSTLSPEALRAAADQLYHASSWLEASRLYHQFTAAQPHDLPAWKRRLDCARNLGQELVVDLLRDEALADHPDWAPSLDLPPDPVQPVTPPAAARTTRRKSCDMIEGGLFFSTNKLRVCCTTHHQRGAPLITDFLGGEFPLEAVLAKRNEIRAANATGVFRECAGCPHLREDEWPDQPAHLLTTLIVGPSAVCDLKCGYCFTVLEPEKVVTSKYELYPILEDLIRRGYLSPDALIFWAGGEPTIFKRFDDMFRLLTAHGRVRHQIYTNATRTSPAVVEALRANRATVVCSLDAGTRETYATIKGRDAFDRVIATSTRYAATGGDFRLKYLGLPGNATTADVNGFLELARRWKVRTIYCDVDYATLSRPPIEVVDALGQIMAGALCAGIQTEFEVASKTVPEERLPDRVTKVAHAVLDQPGSPAQRRWALNPGLNDRDLTPLHMVTPMPGTEALTLRSSGNDPYLLLPEIPFAPQERALIAIDITAAQTDLLEVYYQDENTATYSAANTVKVGLQPGRQRLFLPAFPFANSLKGRIRLDPGCFAGDYVVHQLEVFAVPKA